MITQCYRNRYVGVQNQMVIVDVKKAGHKISEVQQNGVYISESALKYKIAHKTLLHIARTNDISQCWVKNSKHFLSVSSTILPNATDKGKTVIELQTTELPKHSLEHQ